MNEDKNFSTEMIVLQIKKQIREKRLSRPNPFTASSVEVDEYVKDFYKKMNERLPNKSNHENK
jgi:hypothetical protein